MCPLYHPFCLLETDCLIGYELKVEIELRNFFSKINRVEILTLKVR